jgi:hypothetical protein
MVVSFAPDAIATNGSTTFSWSITAAPTATRISCSIDGIPGISYATGASGSVAVTNVAQNLTGVVDCEGNDDQDRLLWTSHGQATLSVGAPVAHASFTPATITRGQSATFQWSSSLTTSCTSADVGGVSATSGSLTYAPQGGVGRVQKTIAVTCTDSNSGQTASASATLTVWPAGRPQVVIFPGTGGVGLVGAAPEDYGRKVWIDFPTTPILGELRDWNAFFLHYLELKLSPTAAEPFRVVPAHSSGVVVPQSAFNDDGLVGSACLTNRIGNYCPYAYLADMVYKLRESADVKVVPYDWRRAWTDHYATIRQIVDDAYARGQGEPVYFVGHSQGTQLLRVFLMDNPSYRSKVAQIFNLGAPHLGSPVATTYNTPATGGGNFGFNNILLNMTNSTGLKLGGFTPPGYAAGPTLEAMRIMRLNMGHWMFEKFDIRNGVSTRTAPVDDTLASARQYMRSLSISQNLFDYGSQIQDALLTHPHYIPNYQIVSLDRWQAASWIEKDYWNVSNCSNFIYCGSSAFEYRTLPSDGTIPTFSSLGQFSGGPNLGTLAIQRSEDHSEHQEMVKNTRALEFIRRAIMLNRGFSDSSFPADYPLMSDQDLLQHIGWSLTSAADSSAAARLHQALAGQPAERFEFTTPDIDATMNLTLTDRIAQSERVYRVTKAGVELVSQVPAPQDTSVDFAHEDSKAPTLMAITTTLFRDTFGDDKPLPADAITGDLTGLDLHVPLPSDDVEVKLTADRPVGGLARTSGNDTPKVAPNTGISSGETMRYERNAATGPNGVLYRGSSLLPMVDDVGI